MTLQSPGKLALLTLVALGCIVYLICALFVPGADTTAAWSTLAAIIGYAVGNGVGAVRGLPQQPTFAPKSDDSTTPTGA